MVLLVFLVDTSASMNQRTCLGTSYLDLAKGAVESFLKIRARDTNNIRGDRYMLVTYDETKCNKKTIPILHVIIQHNSMEDKFSYSKPLYFAKAGWRDNLQKFLSELKNLTGHGLSNIGRALKETFDLLNLNRISSGIDNYGMGRNPYYLEPALVLLLTDGCSALDIDGIINEITLPTHDLLPGGELTKELYRWDQRLFTIHLKIPGVSCNIIDDKNSAIQPEDIPLSNLCDQTGGKLYSVGSHKNLMQTLESVAQKIMVPGVIINFDKYGPDPQEVVQEEFKNDLEVVNTPHNKNLENPINCNGPLNNCVPDTDKDFAYKNFKPGVNGFINGQGILPSPHISVGKSQNKIQNGIIDDKVLVKTEGLPSNSSPIPGIPIRGNDDQVPDRSLLSPNPGMNNISTAWHNQRRMIFVRSVKENVGHWPIPESFWPESSATRLPPRDCQPVVKFTCKSVDAMVIENMPFDKYELEPSPLTQYILERRQPNSAWQTFVSGSSRNSEIGYPFGYLKAATNLQCVNLFVMPYNYPIIMPLLDELFKIHKCKPNSSWRQSFNEYLQTVPAYYFVPLRNALRRMGAPNNLIPDHYDGSLSYSIIAYLKKLKHQAKAEADRLINLHSQRNEPENTNNTQTIPRVPQVIDGKQRDFKDLLIQKTTNYRKKDSVLSSSSSGKEAPFEKRFLPNYGTTFSSQSFRNPFDIHHSEVIDRCARMRLNFFHTSTLGINKRMVNDDESRHVVSIAQMGNYQEHKQHKPLREVDPSQVRVHTFGNPFKLKQDQIIAVDEADVTENMQFGQNARKRNGEVVNSLQKGKRKRSETPPPSRRPVGTVPNTPPPRLSGKLNDDNDKRKDILYQSLDDNSETKDALENDTKENDKKPSVNKQLRKLQSMHRNKKENHELKPNGNKLDTEISDYLEGSSPILSILRTSLEEPEDKDNDELRRINEHSAGKTGQNLSLNYDDDRSSSTSNSSRSSSSLHRTPVSTVLTPLNIDDLFVNHTKDALAKIYKQLHNRKVVRTRLSVWQAIRDRADFSKIADMIKSLPVDVEARLMFTLNLLRETEKFQLETLEKKLKKLLNEL